MLTCCSSTRARVVALSAFFFCVHTSMSRYNGSGWYDGYGFHGAGHKADPRHTHAAIHPKFRSAREDFNKGSFGWTSTYSSTPMNPSLRGIKTKPSSTSARVAARTPRPESGSPRRSKAAEGDPSSKKAAIAAELHAVLRKHAPGKLPTLPKLLSEWAGREDALLKSVRSKYAQSDSSCPEQSGARDSR